MNHISNTNKTFYDPVHGVSLIASSENGLQSLWKDPDRYCLDSIFSLCDTVEFKRMHFLRQAGFCFHSYPSATHTRFGHSVGTCHLGRAALDQVDVKTAELNRVKLGGWLKEIPTNQGKKDLRDEFLLALLLHDIGHFPFSHILEGNPHLRKVGLPNHEEIAVDLILDKTDNKIVKAYTSSAYFKFASKFGGLRMCDVLKDMEKRGRINRKALAYLICHTRREELALDINDSALIDSLNLIGNLVSGVVDVDRLDHYIRDLYFTGAGLSVFNVFKLLNAICLDATTGKVYIDEDTIPQVFNLLHAKESLRRYVFEDPKNMAFNAMLNYCVSAYLEAQGLKALKCNNGHEPRSIEDLLTLYDDQLLSELELVNTPASIKQMIYLIRSGQPYDLIDSISVPGLDIGQSLEQRAHFLAGRLGLTYLKDELPDAIFLLQDAKGKVSLLSMDELLYQHKLDNKWITSTLSEAIGFEHFIKHLCVESDYNELRCWIFSKPGLNMNTIDSLKEKLIAA